MAQQAESEGLAVTCCETHEQAVNALCELMHPGDALLAKASRGMKLETVLTALYEKNALDKTIEE